MQESLLPGKNFSLWFRKVALEGFDQTNTGLSLRLWLGGDDEIRNLTISLPQYQSEFEGELPFCPSWFMDCGCSTSQTKATSGTWDGSRTKPPLKGKSSFVWTGGKWRIFIYFFFRFLFFSEPKLWLLNFIEFINLKYFISFLKFNEKWEFWATDGIRLFWIKKKKRVFLGLKENKKIIHSHFINM